MTTESVSSESSQSGGGEKHSPLPWRIAHRASDYTYIEQQGGNFLTVAKVCDVIEREANAQLIVTAVNSYASSLKKIEALSHALKDLVRQLPTDERLADFNLDLAEAALAEREGEK